MPDDKPKPAPLGNEAERFVRYIAIAETERGGRRNRDKILADSYSQAFFPGQSARDAKLIDFLPRAKLLISEPQVSARLAQIKDEIFSCEIMTTNEALALLSEIARTGELDSSKIHSIKLLLQVSGELLTQIKGAEEMSINDRAQAVLELTKSLRTNTEVRHAVAQASVPAHKAAIDATAEPFTQKPPKEMNDKHYAEDATEIEVEFDEPAPEKKDDSGFSGLDIENIDFG